MNCTDTEIENLIKSIGWHKEHCKTHDCNVSIFHLRHLAIEVINKSSLSENEKAWAKESLYVIGD